MDKKHDLCNNLGMRVGFKSNHLADENGNPTGGSTQGTGFTIAWQHGPLGRGEDRLAPNGAFVEDVIDAALDRIRYMNSANGGKFSCIENERAIDMLSGALASLDQRTNRREAASTEGTHTAE